MNFLSVTFDDLNAFAFIKSTYPGLIQTPNIDRIMAMGTTFENAYAQIAVCNASRTSALSGLNPGLTAVHHNYEFWYEHVAPGQTLPGVLKSAGFQTSVIGKIFHQHEMPDGVSAAVADFRYRTEGGLYEDSGVSDPHPSSLPLEQQGDYLATDHAIAQLNAAGDDPFAIFLGIAKPHLGWVVPQEFFDLYPLDQIELPEVLAGDLSDVPAFMRELVYDHLHDQVITADAWKMALQGYFASISFADAMLGRVIDTLEANGQMDDTAILLWTDHGYHLGDKDNWHKFTLWEEAARAPFVLALPGQEDDGQRVGQAVELVDMMPTVLDLMGLEAPEGLSGRSLRDFIEDPTLTDDGVAITTMYGSAAIRDNAYRFIRYEDGSAELYDLVNDPHQWTNLADDPAWETVRDMLDTRLQSELVADGWLWIEPGQTADGTAGAESFVLRPGAGQVAGGDGDDIYFIGDGAATIVEAEGGGIDTVYTSESFTLPDHVENLQLKRGGDGDKVLIGNSLDNFMLGSGLVEGLGGNDFIRVWGPGTADGGAGDDYVQGAFGRDLLWGGAGNDVIFASEGTDRVEGGAGNDDLDGGWDTDTASYEGAAAGVTLSLAVEGPQDTIGAGTDSLLNFENLSGSAFADTLAGDQFDNVIKAGAGDDVLAGGGGADTLDGGEGSDLVSFAASALAVSVDLVDKSAIADAVSRVVRVEDVEGSAFDDGVSGSAVANRIMGRSGIDELSGLGGADMLNGGQDDDVVDGGAGNDRLMGMAGNDALDGGDGLDFIQGNDGDDHIVGAAGNDRLVGNDGADLIEGGGDDDRLTGGGGRDKLSGGTGRDMFMFGEGDSAAERAGADIILDFSTVEGDRVNLKGLDADAGAAGNQRFRFIGDRAFDGNAGQLRYESADGSTFIEGDTDGDGAADFSIRLENVLVPVNADFVL
ncbi:sulfatase-like hydrolase/transferase [Enterovirga sp. GCM10030262]|uniref:sulfatase-like hydrolase/transferase n=1 Tax=Enterovirga sp. GCM10030262 TaxID=3273391 RepID=UPI0036103659